MHANINLNNKNKELGKHRTISVPRFSNYHLNISNNNNINYNNNLIKSSTLIERLLNNRIIQKKGMNRTESA